MPQSPAGGRPRSSPPRPMPSSSPSRPLLLFAALIPLIIGLAWLLVPTERDGRGELREPQAQHLPPALGPTIDLQAPLESMQASRQGRAATEPEQPSQAAAAPSLLAPEESATVIYFEGHTVDPEGLPIPNVELGMESAAAADFRSDAQGYFSIELTPGRKGRKLECMDPRYTTLSGCRLTQDGAKVAQWLVLAQAVSAEGKVVDRAGLGLAGVRIVSQTWRPENSSFPHALDRGERLAQETVSDASGQFKLDGVPRIPNSTLHFALDGYQPESLGVDQQALLGILVRLSKQQGDSTLPGIVLLEDGSPAKGAKVYFSGESTLSDSQGNFELKIDLDNFRDPSQKHEPRILAAALAPFQPAIIEDFGRRIQAASPGLPSNLVLNLGPQALALAGRVVDEAGHPLAGWNVLLRGAHELSQNNLPIPTAEGLAGTMDCQTDEDGHFNIEGLLAMEYELWAWEPESLRSIEPPSKFQAGTQDIELVARKEDTYEELRGQVLSPSGEPLAGVLVSGTLITSQSVGGFMSNNSNPTSTDAEGRFVLKGLGRQGLMLSVYGDGLMPSRNSAFNDQDPLNLRLTASRRCHFRLFVEDDTEDSHSIAFLDSCLFSSSQIPRDSGKQRMPYSAIKTNTTNDLINQKKKPTHN